MITILRSPFFRKPEIAVPSGRIDLRPPKIIVGISLTLVDEEDSFPQGVVTLPAILDTGFNRILEIDEWHLVHWAGLLKKHLELTAKDRLHEWRKFDLCEAEYLAASDPLRRTAHATSQLAPAPGKQSPVAGHGSHGQAEPPTSSARTDSSHGE